MGHEHQGMSVSVSTAKEEKEKKKKLLNIPKLLFSEYVQLDFFVQWEGCNCTISPQELSMLSRVLFWLVSKASSLSCVERILQKYKSYEFSGVTRIECEIVNR